MEVKSFYSCQSSGDEVPSADPVSFDRDTAIDVALQILRTPGDFIGFIDSSERVIQFCFEEPGDIWVEHPSPRDGGSFGKRIAFADLEPLLINLPEKFHKMCMPGLEFRAW